MRQRWLRPFPTTGSVSHDPTAPSFQAAPLLAPPGPVASPRTAPMTQMQTPKHKTTVTLMLPTFMPPK